MPAVDAPRVRRSFARLNKVLDVPNLIAIQRRSFEWLTDPETGEDVKLDVIAKRGAAPRALALELG